MNSSSKPYSTLPGPLRPRQAEKKRTQDHPHSPLFGLNLNLNFSNLITSGVHFLDNLRKKTPSTPLTTRVSLSSHSSSDSSASFDLEEQIEMVPFQPGEGVGQGEGHEWREGGSHNPTWCDLCGELIWGLYDTGTWVCNNCNFTAHLKCRDKVKLDCSVMHSSSEDTEGILQSWNGEEEEDDDNKTDISSYATAADTLQVSYREEFHSLAVRSEEEGEDTFHTLKEETSNSQDEFHTLKGIEELEEDQLAGRGLLSLPTEELELYIGLYNSQLPTGQETIFDPEEKLFKGFIRVEMNLQRPINVISGTRPPSFYNIMKEDTVCDRTLTTFYLPAGTEKALHITSHTTTQDVIRSLLKKFKVADNPHKYALYEKCDDCRRDSVPKSKSLSRPKMRRMGEEEKPLVYAIMWGARNSTTQKKFVLQENDPGEILWEQFSLPELKNFLLILDREEAWYKRRIHEKYEAVQEEIQKLLESRRPQ